MKLFAQKKQVKPWDETFARWAKTAAREGVDPNDIGDREWGDPMPSLQAHYLPHVCPESDVLELGPGSGRIARHFIGRCRKIYLADDSQAVCEWLSKYLAGKGNFQICLLDKPAFPMIAGESIDFAFAFGVFEHLDLDEMRWYVEEFHRVLKSGATAIFNFDNFMSEEGIAWHARWRGQPGHRNIFRFYHPDMVHRVAEASGFRVTELRTSRSRHAEIELDKI